jgi:Holliday junction resolvase RusA-like endonuclease
VSERAVVEFTVLGRPQPAGSKRAFRTKTGRTIVTDDNKRARPWKSQVAAEAAAVADGSLLSGPLELEVVFWFARPKGHYGTGRNADRVRPSAPAFPAVRPDATKCIRAVEDALNGVLWRDDAQVVVQHVEKRFGHPERAEVAIRRLEGRTA